MGLEFGKASLSTADRIDFFKTLSEWLSAGAGQMPLAEAVRNTTGGFSQEEYATLAPRMEMIASEVASGQTPFYEALGQSNLGFRPQELAVIEAAERSSQLRQALPSLVTAMETEHQGRKDLIMKLTGPLIIGVMLIALTLGILTIMLPMVITPVIDRNPKALETFPFILVWFWYTSVWLRANYIALLVVLAAVIILFFCRNLPALRPYWLRFLLQWSVSRKLVLGFNSMLVVYFMPALLRSGMPSYEALDQLAGCVRNPLIASLLLAAAEDHRGGVRISQAVSILPFKASFFNAIESGEATGAIADRVQDLQGPYRYELERTIKNVANACKLIVMVVLMPLFIVSTYTSLVGPIFALMEYGR